MSTHIIGLYEEMRQFQTNYLSIAVDSEMFART